MHLISRVVGVAAGIKGVEGAPVVVIEGKAELDPLGQIRIRNKVATEGNQAGIAIGDGGLRCIGLEAAGSDDRPLKDLTQLLRCDRTLPFSNQISALYSRLDEMQIGQPKDVEPLCDITEQCTRITVSHAVVGPAWRDADADTVCIPDRDQRLDHIDRKSRSVFDRAAVAVGALVAVVLEKLVDQMTIRGHNFDAVEPCTVRVYAAGTVLLDYNRA